MVNKRRARKVCAPYKRYVGTGLPTEDGEQIDHDSNGESEGLDELELAAGIESIDLIARIDGVPEAALGVPAEVFRIIMDYSSNHWRFLTVNSKWFEEVIKFVYKRPKLSPRNFGEFVTVISTHRSLGAYVCDLDLTQIIQTGKNSLTARLLTRCSPRLELFIAPQSNFGYSPLLSLRHCKRLRTLDLGMVSEKVDLPKLIAAVEEFQDLEVMRFPRSSIMCECDHLDWPPNLRTLGLAGGLTAQFLESTVLPSTVTTLELSNIPTASTSSITTLLARIGPQLKRLVVMYPLQGISANALDSVLLMCPNLKSLTVSVDYVSDELFAFVPENHPLETLKLLSSGMIGHSDKIRPLHITASLDSLPFLTRVGASLQLGWNPNNDAIIELASQLEDRNGGLWLI